MGEHNSRDHGIADTFALPRWAKITITLSMASVLGLLGYLLALTENAQKAPAFGAFGVVAGLIGGFLIAGVDRLPPRWGWAQLGRRGSRWPYHDLDQLFGPDEKGRL